MGLGPCSEREQRQILLLSMTDVVKKTDTWGLPTMQNLRFVFAMATFALYSIWTASSQADDICQAIAVRDVPAIEEPKSILRKGELDDAITEFRVNKRSGETSYCSHGGYCYPTHVHVGDDLLLALKMTNCRPSADAVPDDAFEPDLITYPVDVIRSRIPAAAMRREDVKNQMLAMGLCSACADNVAEYYTTAPTSKCADLARSALEGNPEAAEKISGMPDYCVYHYPPAR